MAVHFYTSDPRGLLDAFKIAVNQTELEGKITTWRQWQSTDYYTHTSAQWQSHAYMQAVVKRDTLTFFIVNARGSAVSQTVYGFYHGHLIETFLNHFDKLFEQGAASALPGDGDIIE